MQTSRKAFDSIRTISILSTAMTTAASTPESAGVVLPAARPPHPPRAPGLDRIFRRGMRRRSHRRPVRRARRHRGASRHRRHAAVRDHLFRSVDDRRRPRPHGRQGLDPAASRPRATGASSALELSPAGQDVLQQVEPGIRRVQERLLAPLTAAEAKTLVRLLAKMADGDEDDGADD